MCQAKPLGCWYIVNVEAAIWQEGRYLMIIRSAQDSHAPGMLSMPGGKVEGAGSADNILEQTLRREIEEEVGVQIAPGIQYVKSSAFIADDGDPVVDIVFLCRYQSGTPTADPEEVADVQWMTVQGIMDHPRAPSWTRQSIVLAEKKRTALGMVGGFSSQNQ